MSAPPEVWIDARVANQMPQGCPDEALTAAGAEQVQYFSSEKVRELLRVASGGSEFIIQVMIDPLNPEQFLIGLTNYGRICYFELESQNWSDPINGPDLLQVET